MSYFIFFLPIFYLILNNMEDQSEENNSERNQLNENNINQNTDHQNKRISCFHCCYDCCFDCCSDCCSYSCSFSCSKNTNFWFRIICCPIYCFIFRFFDCFLDDRYEQEPYYQNILFVENVLVCISSIIDLVFLIIYKGDLNIGFFVVRIISDSIGIFVLWCSFTTWSEEALDEDHMDPAFLLITIVETIIGCILDFVSWILFLSIDFKLNTTLYASLILHFLVPIIMIILFKFR